MKGLLRWNGSDRFLGWFTVQHESFRFGSYFSISNALLTNTKHETIKNATLLAPLELLEWQE